MSLTYHCDTPGCDATAPAVGRERKRPENWRPALEERGGITVMIDQCAACAKRRQEAKAS